MTITYHKDLIQGTEPWKAARLGLLTASEMKNALSRKTDRKTGEVSFSPRDDYAECPHLFELLAQRITQHVEPQYISDDMLRGHEDEIYMRDLYSKKYAPVEEVGFITNDKWGFTLGYSPDGLVTGTKGAIEGKSRCQKYQIETILSETMPDDYRIQVQTGMLVAELEWLDFNSYCGGMYMMTTRVLPDLVLQGIILDAAQKFHATMDDLMAKYYKIVDSPARLIMTERRVEHEIITE